MATKTWNGGAGNYRTGSNWSPSGVPVAGDTVIIQSGAAAIASGTIDGNFLRFGSNDPNAPAKLLIGSVTFGAGERIFAYDAGEDRSGTNRYSEIDVIGRLTNDGTIAVGLGIRNRPSSSEISLSYGATLVNNGTIEVGNLGNLRIDGSQGARVVNNGAINTTGGEGRIVINAPLTGYGVIDFHEDESSSGTVEINNSVGVGQTVDMGGNENTDNAHVPLGFGHLVLDKPLQFLGTVNNFNDVAEDITLAGVHATGESYGANGWLTVSDGSDIVARLHLVSNLQTYSTSSFDISNTAAGAVISIPYGRTGGHVDGVSILNA